jgi:hypothetical protein
LVDDSGIFLWRSHDIKLKFMCEINKFLSSFSKELTALIKVKFPDEDAGDGSEAKEDGQGGQ